MDAQVAAQAAKTTRDKDDNAQVNKKRRERRNFKKYGEAGKPVIDKVAKRVAINKKQREVRSIKKQARHAAQDANPRDAKDMKRLKINKYARERNSRIKTAAKFMGNVFASDISPDV